MRKRRVLLSLGAFVVLLLIGGGAFVALGPRVRTAAVRHAPGPASPVWLGRVAVFDGERLLRDQDVLLRGPTVAAVTPAGQQQPPADALRIDGAGKTLLPGLVDSHVHLFIAGSPPWTSYLPDVPANARALLYAGVTSVLVAQSTFDEDKLDARAAAGAALSPHLYRAGPGLTAPGGHPIPLIRALVPWPISALAISVQPTAGSAAEARAQVARIRERHHPPLLKIFYDDIPDGTPHLSREALAAAIAAAREQGMRPVVHIGASADMVAAAEAGAALLMHPPSKDLLSDEQVARLRALGVPFVTTMRTLLAADEVARTGGTKLERESIDPAVLAAFRAPPAGWTMPGFAGMERKFPEAAARMRDNVRKLALAGVPYFVGTDAGVFGVFPGASLHGELQALGRLGLQPRDLLRAATSAPAAFLEPAGTFGRVAPGQRADLLLVRGDPLADLAALEAIEEVFLGGARLLRQPL